ncbi:MAG: sialidase family protein [Betaproteobacteria bacterium]
MNHSRQVCFLLLSTCLSLAALANDKVVLQRIPDGGLQPQVATDTKGHVHLVYFKGNPAAGNLYYVQSLDGGKTFGPALRVNSDPDSAIAVGNVRGAHVALGRNGRVHVAWMGSDAAPQKGAKGAAPMLYARLADGGSAFEPQRNVIRETYGLDGGGTVSADPAGNVFVYWNGDGEHRGEAGRRIFVVKSTDDGKTFGSEMPASAPGTGACSCCGLAAANDSKGNAYALYRSASDTNRDMYFISSRDKGRTFQSTKIADWAINACPLTTAYLEETGAGVLSAWESQAQVYFSRVNPGTLLPADPVAAPGPAGGRKYPAVAASNGETILAWTEGMGWSKGGAVAWQVYDSSGRPTGDKGRVDGVPAWSLVAVFPRGAGGFTILY